MSWRPLTQLKKRQFSGCSCWPMLVVDSLSMASNRRPYLGVGKYSKPDASIDDPDGVSVSLTVLPGQARNSWMAAKLVRYSPVGERYLKWTLEIEMVPASSVIQLGAGTKSSDTASWAYSLGEVPLHAYSCKLPLSPRNLHFRHCTLLPYLLVVYAGIFETTVDCFASSRNVIIG